MVVLTLLIADLKYFNIIFPLDVEIEKFFIWLSLL